MDEDKKINPTAPDCENEKENSEPGKEEIPAEQTPEELNEELENLRDTFQQTYDETVEESENGPVIQELEEGSDEEETEEEEPESEMAVLKVKEPKKKKKGKIAGIVIAVVLCVAVIGPLLAFFILSVAQPNFSAFVSVYSKALSAEEYDDKVKYYQEALKLCKGDSNIQKSMSTVITEQLIVDTYKEKDYSAAYNMMMQMMTPEQIAHPANSEFKKFLKIRDSIKDTANKAFAQIFENVGDSAEVPADETLLLELNVPENVKTSFLMSAKTIAEGYIFDRSADSIEDYLLAVNYYAQAYSGLLSIGADGTELAENMCIALYNNGFIFEAASISSIVMQGEQESDNKEFNAILSEIASCADFGKSVYELAVKANEAESGATKEAVLELVKAESSLSENLNDVVADIVVYAAQAVKNETENNLTLASKQYSTLVSVLKAFSMSDFTVEYKSVETLFYAGNFAEAQKLSKEIFTDEVKASATEEQTAFIEKAEKTFDALVKTSEVFGPYMSQVYQTGAAIDFEEASAALDELITEEADDYLKAFVAYSKYYAALYAKGNEKGDKIDPMTFALEMSELVPDQPCIFGQLLIDEYIKDKNFSAAAGIANTILAVNIADDYANSIVSFDYRTKNDLDKSLEAALRGIELSGMKNFSAREAAIVYMLKGDFESAFGHLNAVCQSSMSVKAFDLMLIFNHIYDGENEEIKSTLETLIPQIQDTYKQYQITSYEETLAVLDGSKTIENVFLNGSYSFVEKPE